MNLAPREIDTVLAALRCWQRAAIDPASADMAIASENGVPLTSEEIDALAEYMNSST